MQGGLVHDIVDLWQVLVAEKGNLVRAVRGVRHWRA
jgi:hypothetical protein